jgi:hypothetical protein
MCVVLGSVEKWATTTPPPPTTTTTSFEREREGRKGQRKGKTEGKKGERGRFGKG